MPYVQVIESYREFAERHGGQELNCNGMVVFADGASANADNGDIRYEPPCDPVELLRMKLTYWRQAVKVSERDISNTRKQYLTQGPPSNAVAWLNEIAAAVRRAREEVAKLEKELANHVVDDPGYQSRMFRIQNEQEQRLKAAQLLDQIASITI